MEYVELEERREREPLRQRRYLDEDNDPRLEAYRESDREPETRYQERARERDREREFPAAPRYREDNRDESPENSRGTRLDVDRDARPRYRDPEPEPEPWRGYGDDEPVANGSERARERRPRDEWRAEPANSRPLSYGPPSSGPRDEDNLREAELADPLPSRRPAGPSRAPYTTPPVDVEAEPMDDPW
jgi:hypothetical protein